MSDDDIGGEKKSLLSVANCISSYHEFGSKVAFTKSCVFSSVCAPVHRSSITQGGVVLSAAAWGMTFCSSIGMR